MPIIRPRYLAAAGVILGSLALLTSLGKSWVVLYACAAGLVAFAGLTDVHGLQGQLAATEAAKAKAEADLAASEAKRAKAEADLAWLTAEVQRAITDHRLLLIETTNGRVPEPAAQS